MGVRIMHYRARIAGGTLDIRPAVDGGTIVSCTILLNGRRS
jgi:signal transduction histidine kinase